MVSAIDNNNNIIDFVENPENPPTIPNKENTSLASMGIYVFKTKFLADQLRRDAQDPNSSRDFGKDIIPYIVKNGKAIAHHFSQSCVRADYEDGVYWRDVGTIDAFWEANIDLTHILPKLNLYDTNWPIWTHSEITPPAKFVHDIDGRRGEAISSLVSGACIISGAHVHESFDVAVRHTDAARALDMQEKYLDRVFEPGDFEATATQGARFDRGTVQIDLTVFSSGGRR